MRLRPALLAALLLVVFPGAACGDPEPAPSGDPEARLAALPGVRAAEVGADDAADDPQQRYVVVDAEPGATADQVADALRAVADLDPSRSVLYLGAGNTELSQPLDAPVSQVDGTADPDTSAARLLAGAALDGTRVTVDAERGTVQLFVDGGDAAAVGTTAGAVVADDVLAAAPVSVTATRSSTGQSTAVAVLASDQPLTGDLVAAWTALADAGRGLGATLSRLTLAGGSAVRVEALLDLPAPATPASAPQVLPLLHAALDTVRTAPPGAVVQLSVGADVLLSLTTGPDGPTVAPDPRQRGWGDVATAYLTEPAPQP